MTALTPQEAVAGVVDSVLTDLRTLFDLAHSDKTGETAAIVLAHATFGDESIAKELAGLSEACRAIIASHTHPGTQEIGGVIVNHATRGGYVWLGREVTARLAARVADEAMEAGEPIPPGALTARVADVISRCAGLDNASFQWRKGEVEKLLKLSEVRVWREGAPRVEVVQT